MDKIELPKDIFYKREPLDAATAKTVIDYVNEVIARREFDLCGDWYLKYATSIEVASRDNCRLAVAAWHTQDEVDPQVLTNVIQVAANNTPRDSDYSATILTYCGCGGEFLYVCVGKNMQVEYIFWKVIREPIIGYYNP